MRRLEEELTRPLPGRAAQKRMAPRPRPGFDDETFRPKTDPRRGGVLVLFYPNNGEPYLPLILRPRYNGVHSGQVGFPGGGWEEIDADLTATALREAYEEIGVQPDTVHVLGHLSELYILPSNYIVLPTVGWTEQRPQFRTDPYEVAKLLEVPLAALQNPSNQHEEQWQLRDRSAVVPYFSVENQIIWGATAMMLSELLEIVERAQATSLS
jgi:8-oxo-dGTP pyrophosphatase MutT (NUDIX family)